MLRGGLLSSRFSPRSSFFSSEAGAAPSFAQSANPIQIENQNPGTSSWLLTNVANNNEIEGYASLTSVNAGDPIDFYVNTIDPQYTLTIYRLGYYGGLRRAGR